VIEFVEILVGREVVRAFDLLLEIIITSSANDLALRKVGVELALGASWHVQLPEVLDFRVGNKYTAVLRKALAS